MLLSLSYINTLEKKLSPQRKRYKKVKCNKEASVVMEKPLTTLC